MIAMIIIGEIPEKKTVTFVRWVLVAEAVTDVLHRGRVLEKEILIFEIRSCVPDTLFGSADVSRARAPRKERSVIPSQSHATASAR